jgi:DNA-binding NtrC family response regulator
MTTKKSPVLHILVVDDEPLIRWSMTETLAHAGHQVAEAGDGREALKRLSASPAPDVILLDYRLPDSNDLKLLQRIRETVPETSVIMMTAFGTPDVIAGAIRLGAFRVLNKPVEMKDLPTLVLQAHDSRPH